MKKVLIIISFLLILSSCFGGNNDNKKQKIDKIDINAIIDNSGSIDMKTSGFSTGGKILKENILNL